MPDHVPKPPPLLSVQGLDAHYGDFQALFGVSLTLGEGEVAAVIGANGAGKSTLLKSIAGLLRNRAETIVFGQAPIGRLPAYQRVALGVALVPEGRRLFPSLSVEENLKLGATVRRAGAWTLERIYGVFPVLRERRHVAATSLSGGQQQMVAIGRALMSNPVLLLCDEISLGLAPIVVRDIYAQLRGIVGGGTAAIIVEQDIGQALAIADRITCLQEGRVSLQGTAAELNRAQISAAYFGV